MRGGKVLVTGSEGFVGRHLCEHLAASGFDVLGCDLTVPTGASYRHACDLTDANAVKGLLDWAGRCDYVFHLAAAASVASGLHAPGRFMRVNVEGTVTLCESLRAAMPDARLIFISSSEVYGIPVYLPVDEKHPVNPANPYAISKLAGEYCCHYMRAAHGLHTVVLRPFNHSGAGQRDEFVLSAFARQIVEIEKGLRAPVLEVGNLSAKRDFTHVQDMVRAYRLAVQLDSEEDAFNLCSGASIAIGDALEQLRSLASAAFSVKPDPRRCRSLDVPEICGSAEKFHGLTGWRPEIPFRRILEDLLEYWRGALK